MDKDIKTLLLEAAENNDKMKQDEAFKLALVELVTTHTDLFTATRNKMDAMFDKFYDFNRCFDDYKKHLRFLETCIGITIGCVTALMIMRLI